LTHRPRRVVATRWAALVALSALAVSCAVPRARTMFFAQVDHPQPVAKDCERCHQEIYREWLGSAHAHAWQSETYQTASSQGRAQSCAGCHVPESVDEKAPIVARDVHLDEGVTCLACHLSTQPGAAPLTMRGPASRTSPIKIHPIIAEDPLYRSSELCGRCHELELSQWRESPDPADGPKPTCQQCHMPSVHRKVESVHEGHLASRIAYAVGRKQDLRRHAFAVPEDVSKWLSVQVSGRPGLARIRVENHLPHALPTGAFGRRRIRVEVSWPSGRASREVAGGSAEPLPAGATHEVTVALPRDVEPGDLLVRLERWDRTEDDWTMLAEAP
jgi:hypothetical protein